MKPGWSGCKAIWWYFEVIYFLIDGLVVKINLKHYLHTHLSVCAAIFQLNLHGAHTG